jgi:hypothetical protein
MSLTSAIGLGVLDHAGLFGLALAVFLLPPFCQNDPVGRNGLSLRLATLGDFANEMDTPILGLCA